MFQTHTLKGFEPSYVGAVASFQRPAGRVFWKCLMVLSSGRRPLAVVLIAARSAMRMAVCSLQVAAEMDFRGLRCTDELCRRAGWRAASVCQQATLFCYALMAVQEAEPARQRGSAPKNNAKQCPAMRQTKLAPVHRGVRWRPPRRARGPASQPR